MAKIFFISPVRQIPPETERTCRQYVEKLEKDGYEVYWPLRDTEQNDPLLGINICDTNLKKILEADEVHIWYRDSSGFYFDLGATYIVIRILGYKKKVVWVNKEEFLEQFVLRDGELIEPGGKSFLNVLNFLDKTTGPPSGRRKGFHPGV